MRTKYKSWTKPYIEEHPEVIVTLDQLKGIEGNFALEIGSGKGKFLADMAGLNPELLILGIERNVTCAGITCKKLVENEILNARLMLASADEILPSIKDNTILDIYLNFSDPWPKKRHFKRRLTYGTYLKQYYRVLVKGGKLIIKTDNDDLFSFSQETLGESQFKVLEVLDDYDGKALLDAMTEYEISFREKGQKIHRIVAIKE
ncbi:MAG: tRNA (guanosine(46)-N7)-methyltransferase TrmB [Bacilli bacterium]|jgi:tRNA (guanine-N7-)-methyltransferase|nr:tRNA (guanosine(46)-N7)-methyltransferase TrmB [Bacilli bacterium]MDD3068676.1 tRNA (guanosine(46)-N7)-methyltransferase TrmB [Bacilli bacterium]MDD3841644.1 tRNA (guanosine(46)-N7)-methyltransferase TrmB [Bacilli bacterium]HKM10284.1 tRNA (guanosine(46)-N7)-methyltransferase TrmB [Bacilli bacterium]